jgi:serine/threonine-protein kinase
MDISPANWSVLSRLLDEALDLDDAARVVWLERQESERPELARMLRNLLALHASSDSTDVLAQATPMCAPADVPSAGGLGASDLLGPYRLKRALGAGGMADVWLAERVDGTFEREVALKVPHVTRLRPDLAQRFVRERNILAKLEHPHIARMYDAGIAGTVPYLAMEFVDGQPITTYCGAERLNVDARLRLFAQVLDAVQYAHANLVIHRDLKPSNILVTNSGQVRLLDFGIAKLLADDDESARETQLTRASGRALTPDYASPEQIRGEALTIATDVYSLGVVLYELLAEQRPYRLRHESAAQLEQAIVSVEPPLASKSAEEPALAKRLRGDIDAILNKALKKIPAERYASVEALAAEIERHLHGKPVQARPDALWYRWSRYVLRHKFESAVLAAIAIAIPAGAVAQAAVLLAIAGGATIALWQARTAKQQARLAREQAVRAEEVKRFVLSFFEDADADRGAGRQTTAVDLLKQARKRLEATPIGDHAIRVELLTTIGGSLRVLGEFQSAGEVLAEATRLASMRATPDDLAAPAHAIYAALLLQRGETKLAEQQLDAAETRSRRAGDMRWLSSTLRNKSALRYWVSQHDEAIELAREAIAAAERQSPPIDQGWVVAAYLHLSVMLRGANRDGALEPARHAYTLARELWRDRPTAALLEAHGAYAKALAAEGRPVDALSELKVVARQQSAMLGSDHPQFANTLRGLGAIALQMGDPASAITNLREALRIESVPGHDKPRDVEAATRMKLGDALANAHRYGEALSEWREVDQAYSALHGPQHREARLARREIAFALTRLGQLDEADAIFAALVEQPSLAADEERPFKRRLGQLRSAQGRHDEALSLLGSAPELLAGASKEWPRALALAELGDALLAAGQIADSLETTGQAQELLRKLQPDGSPDLGDVATRLAQAQFALGHLTEALAAAEEATAFWLRFDPANRDAGIAHLWHARALAATGDAVRSAETVRRAAAVLAEKGQPGDRVLLGQVEREVASRDP